MHAVTLSSRNNVEFTAILIFSQQRVLPTISLPDLFSQVVYLSSFHPF